MLSVSDKSIPLEPVTSINEEAPTPVKNRSIFEESVCSFGCFPGWKKRRLDLSPYDKTHEFAIDLLENDDVSEGQYNKTWVYLQSPEGPVEASVSSIVKRLHFKDSAAVIGLARSKGENPVNTALEERIQEIMEAYEQDCKTLTVFFREIRDCWDDKKKIIRLLSDSSLDKDIHDPQISALCKKFLNNGQISLVFPTRSPAFHLLLKEFKLALAKKNGNFASFSHEKVVEDIALWGHSKPNLFVEAKAKKIGADSKGDVAVRLKIYSNMKDPYNRSAIKTDGYVYYDKPEMTGQYVPFSGDGSTWVLLQIESLHYRTGIPVGEIKAATSESGNPQGGLYLLLSNRSDSLEQELHPIEGYELRCIFYISDIFGQVVKYLPIESLKALEMVESKYRPVIDDAIVEEARSSYYKGWDSRGYQGGDIDGANQFFKAYHAEMRKELEFIKVSLSFRGRFKEKGVFWFSSDDFPGRFLKDFKTFGPAQLIALFSEIIFIDYHTPKLARKILRERGEEALRLAIKCGRADLTLDLCKRGIKINTYDANGHSALHVAALKSSYFVSEVFAMDPDVNIRGAAGNTPLHLAILNGLSGSVNLLLSCKDINFDIKNDDGETVVDLIKREDVGGNLLRAVVEHKQERTFKWLLENGVDVNSVDEAGNTALHVAALHMHYLIMQYILEHSQPQLDIRNKLGDRVRDIIERQIAEGKVVSFFVREALGIEPPYDIPRVSLHWESSSEEDEKPEI